MGIYFSPAVGIRLKSWSFSNGKILDGPPWKDERPTYYMKRSLKATAQVVIRGKK